MSPITAERTVCGSISGTTNREARRDGIYPNTARDAVRARVYHPSSKKLPERSMLLSSSGHTMIKRYRTIHYPSEFF